MGHGLAYGLEMVICSGDPDELFERPLMQVPPLLEGVLAGLSDGLLFPSKTAPWISSFLSIDLIYTSMQTPSGNLSGRSNHRHTVALLAFSTPAICSDEDKPFHPL
jgi:hypothetical protein